MQYAPTKTWYVSIKYVLIESFSCQEFDSLSFIESYTRQEFDSPLKSPTRNTPFFVYRCRGVLHTPHKCPWQWANDSSSLYILGRMQYAPTLTIQKIDSLLSIDSPTRYVLGRMQYAPTLTDQKFNSLLSIESSARYVLGRMQYAPTKTWYVSIKYVLIESFSCQEFDSLSFIESYTRQKFESPLKSLTHNDPFLVYRCRGVWHTPHKCP